MTAPLFRDAGQRVRQATWRVFLASVTAGLAWWLAQILLDQPAPIFAPIAAMVSLLDEPGVRGLRAFRLIGGVVVGVGVGEILMLYLEAGPWEIGVGAAVAMLIVAAFSTNPLTLIQAGIAALLVIGIQTPQTGVSRLLSALIGGILALLFSQVLASPSPLVTLGNAARTALIPAARGLRGTAQALTDADPAAAREALTLVRNRYQEIAALQNMRQTSRQIVQRTLRGYRHRHRIRHLDARLSGIESLYTGTVLTARAAHEVLRRHSETPNFEIPSWIVHAATDLARAVETLAQDPRSEQNRRHAYNLVDPLTRLDAAEAPQPLAGLATEIRLVAADLVGISSPDPPASASRSDGSW
ncbi:FUSC family protein [Haloactinomyces albus]|uniref:Uncharacterized membrane protein YgaE (UPF0421/DUF939 family) n=1 Tax=Haloactinomyces albus TaxID=1352928 RepID=A0AAE4CJJ5_9ACTN|nr:FUSC family protein [Haloactinomyces albus]MDR7300085.1 uncharacterized membrane protein YgaE (UPF0421/DUF939 family) [Haloactinomyces albus]